MRWLTWDLIAVYMIVIAWLALMYWLRDKQ